MNKSFSRRFPRLSISSESKELIWEIVTLVVAFALSSVKFFFATYPFGIAFCGANKKRAPFAIAGTALGSLLFIEGYIPYLITLLALVGLRLVGSVWLGDDGEMKIGLGKASKPKFLDAIFMEKTSVRVAITSLCTLGLSVSRVILNGYSYYDIFVLIFLVVFVSILTYAFCTLFEGNESSYLLGGCALLFAFIYAIRGKELFSLDLSIVISYAVTLYASKYICGTKSASLGALLGICHGVFFAPVFAICALVSSFLWSFSYYLAIISALVMSIGYGIFASGYEAIVYLLPEVLLASLVMYPLTRFEIIPRPKFLLSQESKSPAKIVYDTQTSSLKSSLSSVSESFKDISEMIAEISRQAKSPDRDFYKDACLEICEKHCYSCPKKSICWEKDSITTRDNLSRMGDEAFSEGVLSYDFVDEKFLHRCPNIEKIVDEVNALKRELSESSLKSDKLEVTSQDYELISCLIDKICSGIDANSNINEALSDKAQRSCQKLGLKCERVDVFGDRIYSVIVTNIDTESSKCSLSEVKSTLEDALGVLLCEPVIEDASGIKILRLQSASSYDATYFKDRLCREGEEQSGDNFCAFSAPSNKFYALLCDGMGSGRDAYATSKMCVEFMQKILFSCPDKELCLTMLNNFIRAKDLECSSSVDLLEVDLLDGGSSLIKSGAAPSFVKRGDNIFRLHSKTAPIGIMKTLDAEKLDFSLRENDIVVMISDGIASDERDSKYLVDFLSEVEIISSDDPDDTAEEVIQEGVTREALSPANRKGDSVLQKEPSPKGRKIRLCDLPSAIISLARSRQLSQRDDMSVAVIQIKGVGE